MIRGIAVALLLLVALVSAQGAPVVVGYWDVLEMHSPHGRTDLRDWSVTFRFTADGQWVLVHSNRMSESDTWQMTSGDIHMQYRPGIEFGTYNVRPDGRRLTLEGTGDTSGYGYTLQRADPSGR